MSEPIAAEPVLVRFKPDYIQTLVSQLQTALGVSVQAGTLVLNFNQGKLASFKTETYQRIEVRLTPK